MLAKRLSLRELDRICCDFESQWQGHHGVDQFGDFISQYVGFRSDSYHDVLFELVLIDIEKRWKRRSDRLHAQLECSASDDAVNLSFPPDYRAYLPLFDSIRIDAELERALAQAELNARWAFGDIPELSLFAESSQALQRPEVAIPSVQLFAGGKPRLQTDLMGVVLIGRQANGEPCFPAVTEGPPKKLICCDFADSTISRNQLLVEAVAKALVRIENGSRTRVVSLGGEHKLAPGEILLCRVKQAVDIQLKDLRIVVELG